jgi:hypothetical protein
MPNFHGFTVLAVLAHVRARYFPPQIGGLGASITGGEVFRIDHDQAFNQTTHFQYQPYKDLPWIGFNWRYDSGLVASNPFLPDFPTAVGFLDAAQQTAIQMFCVDAGGVTHNATLTTPLALGPGTVCGANPTQAGSRLVNFAGPTFDVDHHPTRVQPRNLFDVSVGDDNIFRADRYRWSLRFTVINLTNKTALFTASVYRRVGIPFLGPTEMTGRQMAARSARSGRGSKASAGEGVALAREFPGENEGKEGAHGRKASDQSWRFTDRVHESERAGGRSGHFAAPASEHWTAKGF